MNNITNPNFSRALPPGVKSDSSFGNLYVEMGQLKWLTYDGINFL